MLQILLELVRYTDDGHRRKPGLYLIIFCEFVTFSNKKLMMVRNVEEEASIMSVVSFLVGFNIM